MALTIRTTPEQDQLIDDMKRLSGEPTSSKAIIRAVEIAVIAYPKLRQEYITLKERYDQLVKYLREIQNIEELIQDQEQAIKEYKEIITNAII